MADLSEKPLETEEGRTESVEAGEDKGGPDTAPEQLETQEKYAKGQDGDPNLDEKPVEEKEAETKPVTRGSKEQDSETTTPKEQKEHKDKEGEEDEETQAVIHYEYGDMYSKPIVSSLPQDTLQFLYPPLI